MRWKVETHDELIERRAREAKEWRRWFAWRPVWDAKNGYCMWLEYCLCKGKDNDNRAPWLYRPLTLLETDLKTPEDAPRMLNRVSCPPGKPPYRG